MTNDHEKHDKEAKERILKDVVEFGCHLALLQPDNYLPGFAYSIGLFKNFNQPEVICFGLHTNVMGAILNHARDLIKRGEILRPGKLYSGFLEGYDVQFLEVNKEFYPNYVGYACWFYGLTFDFPMLQLVWPDKQHKFSWDKDFNEHWKFKQPLLDRSIDFKFYEERNLCVYTTKQAFEGAPILYVYHNDDGAWQFHTSSEPELKDARLVCMEEITKLDPTVNEIYHLQLGWHAWRDTRVDEWQFEPDTNEPEDA